VNTYARWRAGSPGEGEEDEEALPVKRKRFGMNPEVNTTFLPDRDRDEEVT
jgi:hypothetical protein